MMMMMMMMMMIVKSPYEYLFPSLPIHTENFKGHSPISYFPSYFSLSSISLVKYRTTKNTLLYSNSSSSLSSLFNPISSISNPTLAFLNCINSIPALKSQRRLRGPTHLSKSPIKVSGIVTHTKGEFR